MKDAFVSVVLPAGNQARILPGFLGEIHRTLERNFRHYEIVVVDDGSADGTSAVVEDLLRTIPAVRYIRLSRSFGEETAVSAGFEAAIGDWVAVLSPGRDPAELLAEVLERAVAEEDAVIVGVRKGARPPLWERAGRRVFHRLCAWFEIPLVPEATGLMVVNRTVLNSINRFRDKFRQQRVFVTLTGFRVVRHFYEPLPRPSRGVFASLGLAADFVVANSVRPLRLAGLFSLFIGFCSLGYVGYVVLIAIFKENVAEGWVTLSTLTAGAFFVVCVVLAVVAEYLGRVLVEARDRPLYFVAGEKSSSVPVSRPEDRNLA